VLIISEDCYSSVTNIHRRSRVLIHVILHNVEDDRCLSLSVHHTVGHKCDFRKCTTDLIVLSVILRKKSTKEDVTNPPCTSTQICCRTSLPYEICVQLFHTIVSKAKSSSALLRYVNLQRKSAQPCNT